MVLRVAAFGAPGVPLRQVPGEAEQIAMPGERNKIGTRRARFRQLDAGCMQSLFDGHSGIVCDGCATDPAVLGEVCTRRRRSRDLRATQESSSLSDPGVR